MLSRNDLRVEICEGYPRFFRKTEGKEVEVTPMLTRIFILMTLIDRVISEAISSWLTTRDSHSDQEKE